MRRIALRPSSTAAVLPSLGQSGRDQLDDALRALGEQLDGRRLWHVSSTATGGGVAELLSTLLPYALGAGIPVSWLVIDVDDAFVGVTKRLHNMLHGVGQGAGSLEPADRDAYDARLRDEAGQIAAAVTPGDVVVLHDPQTAGLAPVLADRGARVIWRCHIGADHEDDRMRAAQEFLLPDVQAADLFVFSRPAHRWSALSSDATAIIPPCVDVASSKNREIDDAEVEETLRAAGLVGAEGAATMTQDEPIPPDARLVVQVSRWDRLKDPTGLIDAFTQHGPTDPSVRLCIAGPEAAGVTDDPEGAEVLAATRRRWAELPAAQRRRVHLAELPMADLERNATMVNALQRRADVVVQKSLAEGFGLTVTEAMWKGRPVVSTRVGGIQDQIDDGVSGLLVEDATDDAAFGRAIDQVLADHDLARSLGQAARARVCERYLPAHHIAAEADAVARLARTA